MEKNLQKSINGIWLVKWPQAGCLTSWLRRQLLSLQRKLHLRATRKLALTTLSSLCITSDRPPQPPSAGIDMRPKPRCPECDRYRGAIFNLCTKHTVS